MTMKVIHEFVGAAHVYRVVDLDDRYLLQVRGVDVLGAPTWSVENKGSFAWGLLAAELLKRGPAMWVWPSGAPKAPVVPTRLIVRPEDKAITVERHNETGDGWVPFAQYVYDRSDAAMWTFVNSRPGQPMRPSDARLTDEGRFNIYASALASDTYREVLPLREDSK